MKKLMMKTTAALLFVAGAWLMAPPVLAAWHTCITDGGFHEQDWSTCAYEDPETRSGCGGDCGSKKWEKGHYCADGGDNTQCAATPDTEVDVWRRDSGCIVIIKGGIRADCGCSETALATPWYKSSEKENVGNCQTNPA